MTKEIWKDIPRYEGIYQTSNFGRIGSFKNNGWGLISKRKILKPGINKAGYQFIVLYKNNMPKTYVVHRLVLETFIGPCPPGMECRHLDGNPSNNRLDNLKWGTPSENALDRRKHGTVYNGDQRGEKNPNSKLNEWQVRIMKRLFEIPDMTDKEIAEIFNISIDEVRLIRNGQRWKHI